MRSEETWSRRQFDRYVREPFWRSVPFAILAALLAIDLAFGIWILQSFWSALPSHGRFLIVFLLVTAPLILFGAIQQQRYTQQLDLETEPARRILALTFSIAAWGYALIGIALRMLLVALKAA